MKRIISGLICTIIFVCFCNIYVSALNIGHYTGHAQTYYINPDTGVTDDGGSRNEAVGEGMCRSVIAETALIEYDGVNTYATLRVLLLSNIRDLKLFVQKTKGDSNSYTEVDPEIMSEDAENDCADYRFQIPEPDSYIKCSAYIIPMSRDVTFYINIPGELTEGSADFIVSVEKQDTSHAQVSDSITVNVSGSDSKNNTTQNQVVGGDTKSAAASSSVNTQRTTSGTASAAASSADTAVSTNTNTVQNTVNAEQPAEAAATESATEQPVSTEKAEKDKETESPNSDSKNKNTAKTKKGSAGTIVIIIIIVLAFAAAVVAGIRHFRS